MAILWKFHLNLPSISQKTFVETLILVMKCCEISNKLRYNHANVIQKSQSVITVTSWHIFNPFWSCYLYLIILCFRRQCAVPHPVDVINDNPLSYKKCKIGSGLTIESEEAIKEILQNFGSKTWWDMAELILVVFIVLRL